MIDENALSYKRGELVEFKLNLGGGAKMCRGLVLNTAVLGGRAARQLWILDLDDGTPEQGKFWTNKKHIVHEEDIVALIPRVVIGAETILRDNPISFPVKNFGSEDTEVTAVALTIHVPKP